MIDKGMDTQSSIVKRVIDGSVTIDSVEEFEHIVRIFPDDPGVYRAFADLLAEKKSLDAAASAYRRASRLFLDLGMLLQAMVAKILEWRIVQPSHREGRAFYWAIQATIHPEFPVGDFISNLTYPELVAVMVNLIRVRFPADKIVKSAGDPAQDLFFVVSGGLRETRHDILAEQGEGKESPPIDLAANDCFGDIYPLESRKMSESEVKTVTRVELVKISRERLMEICQKYTNIERGLERLYAAHFQDDGEKAPRMVRKMTRHQLPTRVRLNIYSQESNSNPVLVEGFTEDISLGGACLLLGDRYRTGPAELLKGKKVGVEIDLPKADLQVHVPGFIVWSKDVSSEEEKTTAVGVEFSELSEEDRAALEDYCYGSDGEQNLIWSLWESYVKP